MDALVISQGRLAYLKFSATEPLPHRQLIRWEVTLGEQLLLAFCAASDNPGTWIADLINDGTIRATPSIVIRQTTDVLGAAVRADVLGDDGGPVTTYEWVSGR